MRLETGDILDSLRQPLPYAAPMWAWNTVQAYRWDTSGHINVLELAAVLNFIRYATRELGWRATRFFHIVDSRVTSCVMAKGRSSSYLLNRTLRRQNALLLLADLYVMPVWTLSRWNYADAPSRAFSRPAPPKHDDG